MINVIATKATVTGDSDQPGYLEGYGVIDAEQVRELADTATIRPVECPTVSEDEALRYQPSAALERWIRCRDMTCRSRDVIAKPRSATSTTPHRLTKRILRLVG